MIVQSKFRPSWWLRNPHLQTIWASRVRRRQPLQLNAERMELPDNDFIDVLWSQRKTGPVVCLFHGLGGSVDSIYINGIVRALESAGMRPVLMHFRGCSGEPNRLASSYHSGHTDDIRYLINTVVSRNPDTRVHAIGYSLGGNALLKYLGEDGADSPLHSAIAVSPPLVLQEGAKRMNKGLSRLYQRFLVGVMREQHALKQRTYPALELPDAGPETNTFWLFDNNITAPLNGFRDVHDYYTQCSSRQYLQHIGIPTRVLFSADDPFFSPAVIPQEQELSASVTFELSERGGHVAFVSGALPWNAQYWMEAHFVELLQAANQTD